MANFLEFVKEDTKSKKLLLTSMPVKTKTNRRKLNEKVDEFAKTYKEYDLSVKKYLSLKSKSFNQPDTRDISSLTKQISALENVRFILNPTNSYFEKMGFDSIFYKLSNSKEIDLTITKEIFEELISKFEMVGIALTKNDFDYTCYVYEFMTSFLEVRKNKDSKEDLTEIFEKLYWENPELISHIELNFKKLIRKHEKEFTSYVISLQNDIKLKSNMDYTGCIKKLESLYQELNIKSKENIYDIIEMSKSGEIDVNHFFEESKVRVSTYNSLMLDTLNKEDKASMNKFFESLFRLKGNVEEYSNYVKFAPLITSFKTKYLKDENYNANKNDLNKKLKELLSQIEKEEKNLAKLNRKIFNNPSKLLNFKQEDKKDLKIESVKIARGLKELYKKYDDENFDVKVINIINKNFALKDLLHLYYSFDYYKKEAISASYDLETYEELVDYSESFDIFAMDETNVIICPVTGFDEASIARVIINKYRLLNINIISENLFPENINDLLDRINLILRTEELEHSQLTVEKLWFMVQVKKIEDAN